MEIKHTIEILTKDIQDIEKLVSNLQNYPEGSAIELDLAMSKLRNVYEILTMIKSDRLYHQVESQKPQEIESQKPQEVESQKPQEVESQKPKVEGPETAPKEAAILAEKFSKEASINENLASQRGSEKDSKVVGSPIDNIGRNIGINDRFLIIRELFDGNSEDYIRMVNTLDGAGNYNDAMKMIEERFPESMEHEGVGILVGLAKRRFIRG